MKAREKGGMRDRDNNLQSLLYVLVSQVRGRHLRLHVYSNPL